MSCQHADTNAITVSQKLVEPPASASVFAWGARHPAELEAVAGVLGWNLDADTRSVIDRVLRQTIADPIGPEFMAPPEGKSVAA